jgi:hypothetical protein
LAGGRRRSFLSKKRQNQQDPAREIVPKSLGFIGKHQLELAVALYIGRNKEHEL